MKNKELLIKEDNIPYQATHPGKLILDEINARNLTQGYVAKEMGIAANVLNEIIKGKRNITPAIALKLENVLSIDAEYWMKLQIRFEIDSLRIMHNNEVQNTQMPDKRKKNFMKNIAAAL
jgi:HTH-type transcriptional regulator/antitoxin HigA